MKYIPCLLILLCLTSCAEPVQGNAKGPLVLTIKLNAEKCTYNITLKNVGDKPITYIDTLSEKYGPGNIPGGTWIEVRDENRKIVSGNIDSDQGAGWTFRDMRSQNDPLVPVILQPHQEVSFDYELQILCYGLFNRTHTNINDVNKYQSRLVAYVYLASGHDQYLHAETEWAPFPQCIADDYLNPPRKK